MPSLSFSYLHLAVQLHKVDYHPLSTLKNVKLEQVSNSSENSRLFKYDCPYCCQIIFALAYKSEIVEPTWRCIHRNTFLKGTGHLKKVRIQSSFTTLSKSIRLYFFTEKQEFFFFMKIIFSIKQFLQMHLIIQILIA